ncbi:MAG: hypothetical protein ABJA98_01725 [Acidobacteriota bacterium]
MPESFRVTNALLEKLRADAALMALMPDGAWFAEAPPGATRFVIVSAIASPITPMFGGPAYVDKLYGLDARALSTMNGDVQAAASRLNALVDGGDLVVDDWGVMVMRVVEDFELVVEVDDVDASIRWNRCGGQVQVMVAPVAT